MKLKTWDGHNINDGTNYLAILEAGVYGLSEIGINLGMRQGSWPIIGGIDRPGKMIHFDIYIRNTPVDTYQTQLAKWFDPDDETVKQLVVEDAAGGNDRYIEGICTELASVPFSAGLHYVASIQVEGDILWRETSLTTPSAWNVTATGQTRAFTNNGDAKAFPIVKVTPTNAKTGSWPYKRFMVVKWINSAGAVQYPVDIANNSLDTQIASTNFALSNGDDLRVWVDGVEVDRWLDGPNTSTTKVWVNLDFSATGSYTLDGAISAGQNSVTVNEAITALPDSGIIYIGSEAITYTNKSTSTKTFNNCTRGAKGTTAATHADSDPVYWLQHDIWILYGNSSASAPSLDNNYKPMFELASSSNTSWDYNDFRDEDGAGGFHPRSGAWQAVLWQGDPVLYGGNRGATADPWIEIGGEINGANKTYFIYVYNPCGITSANFVNGETYNYDSFVGRKSYIVSGTTGFPSVYEYQVPTPSAATWTAWSRNETLNSGSKSVGIYEDTSYFSWGPGANPINFEVADVTLTLNSSNTPVIVVGAEQGNYSLACTITNTTTGDAIQLTFSMELNADLEADTDAKTVIYLEDDSNQFQSLTVVAGPRRDWLALDPGSNTLRFDDTGTTGVTVTLTWEERHYQ